MDIGITYVEQMHAYSAESCLKEPCPTFRALPRARAKRAERGSPRATPGRTREIAGQLGGGVESGNPTLKKVMDSPGFPVLGHSAFFTLGLGVVSKSPPEACHQNKGN